METVKNNNEVEEKNTTQEELKQEEDVVTTQDDQTNAETTENTEATEEETTVDAEAENEEAPKKKSKRGSRGGSSKALKEENEKLSAELSEMKDKYLRVYAEFENYRRRTSKEKLDIIKVASKDTMKALLPAVDDFARAIKIAQEGASEEAIPEGILLIFDKLMKSLGQQGLKVMESTGQDFDPELHEALTKIPAPTEELKGKVIDTIEQGYTLNDKIIRYAKVVVGE